MIRRTMILQIAVLIMMLAAEQGHGADMPRPRSYSCRLLDDEPCAAAWSEPPPPYSCRLLYDEQRKCSFGGCDKRAIARLTKECLRDGGRP